MNTKSDAIYAAVSRIERAPNMSRVIDAYDAALGGSDVSAHRYRGQWQVWHGQRSGFCGDFWAVRAHLAERAEELLEHSAEAKAASETEQAPAPAMVAQPVQQAQACAAPRVAMQLRRTVTTHGIVAVDVASLGPCPEFPDHGRDEYRVTTAGEVIRTRYVLASGHERWSSPGARPFITPNRSKVTARRTIEAVAECLAASPEPTPRMVPLPVQQQQARASGPVFTERSFATDDWQDDSKASPVSALMREMADDTAPHLNGLPLSHPDVQALKADCTNAIKAGRRIAGGRQGVQTRAANAKKGISQRGLKGSTRQKQWAAEIRGAMQGDAGADAGFAALVEDAEQAKFWIDHRKISWSDLAVRFMRAKERNDAAVDEVRSILLGTSIVSPEQSLRCDELVKIQRQFSRFLRR